jgi:hypothetical protein
MIQDLSKEGIHHHNYEKLTEAADLGCKICVYLQLLHESEGPDEDAEIFHPFTTYSFRPWDSPRMGPIFEVRIDFPSSWLNKSFEPLFGDIALHIAEPGCPPHWWPKFLGSIQNDRKANPWNVREDGFGIRPIPKSTGDPKVMDLGLEWLQTCRDNHVQCEAIDETRQPGYYPSRLLDVGTLKSNILRLVMMEVEPPAQGQSYATLSHCWGNVSFVQLTAENMISLNVEIPPESLPQTFTDAILTSRRLRIRYLWIDSLCILQSGTGSSEDWQFHVGKMDVIYANCLLNLSIARASNPEHGALVTRNPAFIKTAWVYAPAEMGRHNPGSYLSNSERNEAENHGFRPEMTHPGAKDMSRSQVESCCRILR